MKISRFTNADFTQVREVLRNQQDVLLENVQDQVNGYFESIHTGTDPHSRIKVGHLLPLGIFADENRRHASESIAKYRLNEQTDEEGYLVAGATNVLHVARRVVFAYVYSNYAHEADREWVRQVSNEWSGDILSRNPGLTTANLADTRGRLGRGWRSSIDRYSFWRRDRPSSRHRHAQTSQQLANSHAVLSWKCWLK